MKQTPMLQQYLELKARVPDALLLYRLGDFYELFFEDAETAAPVLGVVLTRRRHNDEITSPMCGVPHHALASYARKLLDAGLKVAIAEQVEEAQSSGGLVRREIVRVLTPGTVTEPELLGSGERRWVAAVRRHRTGVTVAYLDAAAGELGGATGGPEEARELLAHLRPVEVLLEAGSDDWQAVWPAELPPPVLAERPPSWFEPGRGAEVLCRTFGVASLRAFDLSSTDPLAGVAGALLAYLEETQGSAPRHIDAFARRRAGGDVLLDAATVRNLELIRDASGEHRASLAGVLDLTVTSMGSRLLREWLLRPLGEAGAAGERHDAVQALVDDPALLRGVRDGLRRLGDLQPCARRWPSCPPCARGCATRRRRCWPRWESASTSSPIWSKSSGARWPTSHLPWLAPARFERGGMPSWTKRAVWPGAGRRCSPTLRRTSGRAPPFPRSR